MAKLIASDDFEQMLREQAVDKITSTRRRHLNGHIWDLQGIDMTREEAINLIYESDKS